MAGIRPVHRDTSRACERLLGGGHHRHLLPAGMLGTPESGQRAPFDIAAAAEVAGYRAMPPLPALPRRGADHRRRIGGRLPRDRAGGGWRPAQRQRGRRSPRTSGFRRAPAPPVPGARRGDAAPAGAVEPGSFRPAPPRRYRPLHHRDRVRAGFRQPPSVQPNAPRDLPRNPRELRGRRRLADRLVADGGPGACVWPLPPPARLGGDARVPLSPGDRRCRARRRRCVPADDHGRLATRGRSRWPWAAPITSVSPRTCRTGAG